MSCDKSRWKAQWGHKHRKVQFSVQFSVTSMTLPTAWLPICLHPLYISLPQPPSFPPHRTYFANHVMIFPDLSWPVCFHTCCSLSLECLFSFYLYPTKFDSSLKWDLLKCHLLCEACVPVNFELNSVVAGYHITCGFASGTPWREVCFYICLKIYQSVWHVLGLQ